MAKELQNPLELTVEFAHDSPVIVTIQAHYGLTCEHNISMRKGMEISLTPAQETAIKSFTASVILPQIKANEGIP